ncbi:MAG: D-amino acid aminotransferase [Gemmatimonadetes bacterium]|jgi:D-alanine transaminase|nr:D-amino acid aminotransferase [Gemmatimonadota bacterium]HBD97860.1 aminotransferase [Gemmatimonadota bacterium]HIC52318.1 aminotransferase [Gemmatimonadota bacterium]HIN52314.1 aminotransferase [Gemmatimonadota bacterium]
MSIVYLNGQFLPKDEAKISPDDRGFLLADGVYEVTPFYEGAPFCLDRHLTRLEQGLSWMRIQQPVDGLEDVQRRLILENGLESAATSLTYIQITRGAAPRTHYFPVDPVEATVYAYAKAWDRPSPERWSKGFTVATVPDQRWSRVDVKTICLLPNVLAFQDAIEAGADDALLVRDGVAIEGAHMNFWGVFDGVLVTHPTTNQILPGITRGVVLDLAAADGIPVEQRPIQVEELGAAEELFFTGTTGEVRPCVGVDGTPVGDGRVGTITKRLSQLFRAEVEAAKEAAAGTPVA